MKASTTFPDQEEHLLHDRIALILFCSNRSLPEETFFTDTSQSLSTLLAQHGNFQALSKKLLECSLFLITL